MKKLETRCLVALCLFLPLFYCPPVGLGIFSYVFMIFSGSSILNENNILLAGTLFYLATTYLAWRGNLPQLNHKKWIWFEWLFIGIGLVGTLIALFTHRRLADYADNWLSLYYIIMVMSICMIFPLIGVGISAFFVKLHPYLSVLFWSLSMGIAGSLKMMIDMSKWLDFNDPNIFASIETGYYDAVFMLFLGCGIGILVCLIMLSLSKTKIPVKLRHYFEAE